LASDVRLLMVVSAPQNTAIAVARRADRHLLLFALDRHRFDVSLVSHD